MRLPEPESSTHTLRALSHPLRSRLLAQLRVHGSATATELAATLETNTGATSYHLRVLEAAGQVRDTASGRGRRRVWEAAPSPPRADVALGEDADEDTIVRWLQQDLVHYVADRNTAWIERQAQWPPIWQQACGLDDHEILVTAEQLSAVVAELAEVFQRYRRVGAGSPGARRVAAYLSLIPVDAPPKTSRTEVRRTSPTRHQPV